MSQIISSEIQPWIKFNQIYCRALASHPPNELGGLYQLPCGDGHPQPLRSWCSQAFLVALFPLRESWCWESEWILLALKKGFWSFWMSNHFICSFRMVLMKAGKHLRGALKVVFPSILFCKSRSCPCFLTCLVRPPLSEPKHRQTLFAH